jgi:hypothetical protein
MIPPSAESLYKKLLVKDIRNGPIAFAGRALSCGSGFQPQCFLFGFTNDN